MHRSSNKGFTLIEVLIATLIFVASVAGFAGSLLMTMGGIRVSKEISDATGLAQDILEAKPTASGADVNPLMGIFNRSWTVTPNSPTNGARTVAVTVTWRDGGTRTIHLQTILTD